GHAPENTLSSFAKALELGAPWVELDVYVVESQLIVFHDDRLERTSNGHGLLQESSFAYLRSLDAGQGERIPTLDEVFALINRRAGINIELKGAGTAEPVANLLARQRGAGWPDSLIMVSSFDHEQLRELRHRDSRVRIGVLYDECPTDGLRVATELAAYAANFSQRIATSDCVAQAHAKGLRVLVYTVNELDELRALRDLGVDGVFTNFPERVLKLNAETVGAMGAGLL
ncbi:MAG: glycerophosphodiester phosphodiesterase family protein, partial [Arenimonas sp.]